MQRMARKCNCWNKLKEEITANAEIFKIKGVQSVYPINRVRPAKRNAEEEKRGDQSFSQMLEKAKEDSRKKDEPREEGKLRTMGGLMQYNRHAVEFCYILTSETDFKA